ncbi:alpha/beta hydrolase [Pseudomonas sp. NA-150]|uniref:alpha/beta hydrolase n=1 Tax=Pseudomonas sp. NA-150 TaxID=3367525 RepID=UPI0037C5B785
MFKQWIVAGLVVMGLGGCASRVDLREVVHGSALTPTVLATTPYALQALLPGAGVHRHLRVYIEGDGHAWATRTQPSTDPTPAISLTARLAANDQQPSAYLARPCQFVSGPNCTQELWTEGRFDRTVMSAMNAGLDFLKQRYGVEQFELVGYSGGAAVALVLAATRSDVKQVQTLAGNLDPLLWTQMLGLSPLKNPVTPLQFHDALRHITQRHFIGLDDQVVPPAIAHAYAEQLQGDCLQMVSAKATHSVGFEQLWAEYSDKPVVCGRTDGL